MALMLTGDRIAHDLFWNGEDDPRNHGEEQLTVELVSEYLAARSQVDVAKRAYKYVLDLISINSEKFFSTAKIVWGKRNSDDDADPTQVYFIKTALDQQMTEAGFDFDAVKKSWYANGYIVYNERHKTYSFTTRIGGMPTNCVLINLPNTEDQV